MIQQPAMSFGGWSRPFTGWGPTSAPVRFFLSNSFKKKKEAILFVCEKGYWGGKKSLPKRGCLVSSHPNNSAETPPQSPSSPKYLKQNKQRRRRSKLSCCRLARFNKVWVRSRDDGSSGRSGGQSTSFDGYSRWDIRQWMVGWPATTAAAGRQSTVVSCEWWCWFTDRIGAP